MSPADGVSGCGELGGQGPRMVRRVAQLEPHGAWSDQ